MNKQHGGARQRRALPRETIWRVRGAFPCSACVALAGGARLELVQYLPLLLPCCFQHPNLDDRSQLELAALLRLLTAAVSSACLPLSGTLLSCRRTCFWAQRHSSACRQHIMRQRSCILGGKKRCFSCVRFKSASQKEKKNTCNTQLEKEGTKRCLDGVKD